MITKTDIIKYLLTRKTKTNEYISEKYINYNLYVEKTGNNLFNKQFGGGNAKPEFVVNYDSQTYFFYADDIDENFFILYSIDKKSKCVIIEIDKENKTATIQDIKGMKNCLFNKQKTGSTLLQITLKLLLKLKLNKKYNINTIILSDDSFKYCNEISENIDMKTMSVLLTGHTWYGKYGFRPIKYKENKVILNEELNEKYNKNIELMNKITIGSIPLINYFTNIKNINSIQINAVKQIILKNPNMLLKDFLNNMLKEFDLTCNLFSQFYIKLFDDIGLKFTGTFYGYFC